MIKNMIILVLTVLLLITVCNTQLDISGISFGLPTSNTETKAERRLGEAIKLIEQSKAEDEIKQKVKAIMEQLRSEL